MYSLRPICENGLCFIAINRTFAPTVEPYPARLRKLRRGIRRMRTKSVHTARTTVLSVSSGRCLFHIPLTTSTTLRRIGLDLYIGSIKSMVRMHSDGYSTFSVCLSVTSILALKAIWKERYQRLCRHDADFQTTVLA